MPESLPGFMLGWGSRKSGNHEVKIIDALRKSRCIIENRDLVGKGSSRVRISDESV